MENDTELDIVIYAENEANSTVYSISAVQFPNVVTQGESIDEAKSRLKEALELYFESAPWEKENLIRIKKANNAPMITRITI